MIAKDQMSFFDQFRIQKRVILALILREMITRYGREGLGILWMIAEPAMFIVGVMTIFSQLHSGEAGQSIAEYLAVSYPTLLLWRNGTTRVGKAIEVNKALLHHRPVRPMDVIYARIILEFISIVAAFLLLYLIFVMLGISQWPADLFTMIIGGLMVMWFSFSFVLSMTALAELSDTIERISHIILYLMIPFSGVFLPAHIVPQPYRDYLLMFPLVDCVEWFHAGYFGSRMETYYFPIYTILANLVFMLFALALTNIAIKRAQTI